MRPVMGMQAEFKSYICICDANSLSTAGSTAAFATFCNRCSHIASFPMQAVIYHLPVLARGKFCEG